MTVKEYAKEFSKILRDDLNIKNEDLKKHLRDEYLEYCNAVDAYSAALELCDIIIIAHRLLLDLGYDPDKLVSEKAKMVQKRLELAVTIYNQKHINIQGNDSYLLAKHILEGGKQ